MVAKQQPRRKDEPSFKSGRRKRRRTGEIIDRILEAAFVEFGRNGFSSTTTASIARRADVTEAQIFNHFGSKAVLFRKAVFKPLDDHFAKFMQTHHGDLLDGVGLEKESREFVSDLVRFVRHHADVFKSLVVNEAYDNGESGSSGLSGLQDYFNKMAAIEEGNLKQRPKVSPHLIARISFASILGSILFDNWLFPVGVASEREIHEGICDFIMEGLNTNAPMQKSPRKSLSHWSDHLQGRTTR